MIGGDGRPRNPALDAAMMAAVAHGARQLVVARPWQGIMPPLAGNEIAPREAASAHHDAAPHASSHDDPEHHLGTGRGAIARLGLSISNSLELNEERV